MGLMIQDSLGLLRYQLCDVDLNTSVVSGRFPYYQISFYIASFCTKSVPKVVINSFSLYFPLFKNTHTLKNKTH